MGNEGARRVKPAGEPFAKIRNGDEVVCRLAEGTPDEAPESPDDSSKRSRIINPVKRLFKRMSGQKDPVLVVALDGDPFYDRLATLEVEPHVGKTARMAIRGSQSLAENPGLLGLVVDQTMERAGVEHAQVVVAAQETPDSVAVATTNLPGYALQQAGAVLIERPMDSPPVQVLEFQRSGAPLAA